MMSFNWVALKQTPTENMKATNNPFFFPNAHTLMENTLAEYCDECNCIANK